MLRRTYQRNIIEVVELRGARASASPTPKRSPSKIVSLYDEGGFDVATLFFSRFKSVISQIPTAQQIIPPVFDRRRPANAPRPRRTTTSRKRTTFSTDLLPRNLAVQMFRALLRERGVRTGLAHVRDGQRDAQRGRR